MPCWWAFLAFPPASHPMQYTYLYLDLLTRQLDAMLITFTLVRESRARRRQPFSPFPCFPSDVVSVPLSRPLDTMLMRMGAMTFPLVRGF
ncbi:hypothetical protein EV715DRAFT_298124 [Schizophyllum commune]